MSPIRPLLAIVLLTAVGCVLPEYERPASNGLAIQDSPGAGGAESKGGSLSQSGVETQGTGSAKSDGGSSSQTGVETQGTGGDSLSRVSDSGGNGNSIGSGGTLFVTAGTTAIDVVVPTASGGASSGGAGVIIGSGGVASSAVESGGGSSVVSSCGGAAGAGGECDCGTGGASSCAPGHATCLGEEVCAVELARNVNHCGACGKRCDSLAPDSTTKWDCVSGTCIVGQCQTGYADCDGNASNGCETDTRTDAMHCGACLNSVCKYPVCAQGVCAETFTAGRADVPSDPATVPDANLITLPTNTIWVWQTSLKANDEVVALGAITNRRGLLFPGTFRMALYDELDGMPNAPVVWMPPGVVLTGNNGMQEYALSEPYQVPVTGQYWVAIWSSEVNVVKIVTFNLMQRDNVFVFGAPATFESGVWSSGASWSSSLASVPPPQGFVGFFPSIYARYLHGETLAGP